MPEQHSIVTLLTDFGAQDGYVAAMKGVILSQAPSARLVDAVHDVPAHDVAAGAWALHQYWSCYPVGTIHVAVVDPGVGSERRALLAKADGRTFLAPDNGLLSCVLFHARSSRVRALKPEVHLGDKPSMTFHGRDIFAYAAGLLASGQAGIEDLSDPIEAFERLSCTRVEMGEKEIVGTVIHVDRFGNLITSITRKHLEGWSEEEIKVLVGDVPFERLSRTYSDVEPGRVLALIGSSGNLEIAVREGSAADFTGIRRGERVAVRRA